MFFTLWHLGKVYDWIADSGGPGKRAAAAFSPGFPWCDCCPYDPVYAVQNRADVPLTISASACRLASGTGEAVGDRRATGLPYEVTGPGGSDRRLPSRWGIGDRWKAGPR